MKLKIITLTLLFILIFNMLISCNNTDIPSDIPVAQKVTNVYRTDTVNIPNNITVTSNTFVVGDRLYVIGMEVIDLETYEIQNYLYSCDFDGGNIESLPIDIEGVSYINRFAMTSDGGLLLLLDSYDIEAQSSQTLICKYTQSGERLFAIDPETLFSSNDSEGLVGGIVGGRATFSSAGGGIYINSFTIDSNDNIYIPNDNIIAVLSSDGEKLFEMTVDSIMMSGISTTVDGKVFVKYYDSQSYSPVVRFVDIDKKALEDPIDVSLDTRSYELFAGTGYDIYVKTTTGLYGYNVGDEESALLCNWINSDVNSNMINDITILSADKLIYTAYDELAAGQRINILTRIPDDEVKEKYLISIAVMDVDNVLNTAIINFNRSNEEYRVVIKDYANNQEQLEMDIVNDNLTDIVLLTETMPVSNYISKGMFADLYQYFDNDPDISREVMLNCVRTPFEYDGKLYQLFTSFTVQTLAGKTANLDNKTSWTIAELLEFINNMDEGKSLTLYDTRETISQILLSKSIENFIDYTNGTCSFDSQEFIDMLNYIASFEKADYDTYNNSDEYLNDRYKKLREDDAYIADKVLYSFTDYLQLKFQFGFEDITLIGYPSPTQNGGTIISGSSYAISNKSLVKDGAWQFLKYLISDELQTSRAFVTNWPATVNGLQYAAEQEMKREYSFYYSGGYSASFSSDTGGMMYSMMAGEGGNMTESVEKVMTQEDVDEVLAFLNGDFSKLNNNDELYNIIYEELEIFYEGSKSAEDTAKIIQSRAAIYISENS